MPFAAALRKSLEDRDCEVPAEFRRGDSLEEVLNRHLRTVEQMGGDDTFTCILLLSDDGKRLSYGAAPTVPHSYCRASDSIEIGPFAGSCGAAAYFGQPVYSPDIASDVVWGDYRDLALRHGFRSCWSTPIRNSDDTIIGTFAILHRTIGMPTDEEVMAIDMITEHVADAIMWSRDPRYLQAQEAPPQLKLVYDNEEARGPAGRLLALAEKLQSKAADLDRYAVQSKSEDVAKILANTAELSRKLAASVTEQITLAGLRKPGQ
jgi:GAF domain-containing protein